MNKSQAKPPPIGITLICLEQIADLSGASLSKVGLAIRSKRLGFPAIAHDLGGKRLWNYAEVKTWMKKNDIKNIIFTQKERGKSSKTKNQETDSQLMKQLIINFSLTSLQIKTLGRRKNVLRTNASRS